jgi:protein O-mannosyl-transferase
MSTRRSVLPIAVICLFFILAFAVHHTAFQAPLQYDSSTFLKKNEYLFNSGAAQAVSIYPQRPLPMITFYLNYLLTGFDTYYLRVVNAFLMACSAAVVVLILNYILEIPGVRVRGTPGQKHVVSFALGLVFLLHPATIYVVVYIWQRIALLSGLFFFLALAGYLATRTGRVKNAVAGYAACAIMFFLAIGSKENAIVLPVVLLLAELAFFHASLRDLLKRSVVFGAVVLIAVLARSFAAPPHGNMMNHGGILATLARYYEESGLTVAQVAMCQCVVFFEYLRMLVLPLPSNVHLLSGQIVPSTITELPATFMGAVGVLAITFFGGICLLKRRPLVGFGTLFFVVTLLPEALMVPQYQFCGYRVFVPMFGLLLIAADGILVLLHLPTSERGKVAMKAGLTAVAGVAMVLLGCATISKEALWMDSIAFWKDVRDRLPLSGRVEGHVKVHALNNLGYYLAASGEFDQAISLLRESLQVDRRIADTYISLGALYSQTGQLDDAVATYRDLLRLDKNNAAAHAALGAALLQQNKLDEALEEFSIATVRKPGHPDYNFGIATVWLKKNDYTSAMPYLQRTIESNPNHVQAHYNMGRILTDAGRTNEAITHYNTALAVDPKFWMAHNNLGIIFATTGRLPEAIDHFRKALKIQPDDVPTQRNLETALATQGTVGGK